ncbi:Ribulose-phosphate 3 epimerase family protein [uncultured archaeon]|nr:Ribulose-phosphate 3 epimerase family protein [uncultured archaeon]
MEIVPGILVHNLKELKEALHKLSWAKKVHIDIMDGKFVHNKTIQAITLKKALPRMEMQIHLMAYKPHTYVNKFARLGAKELIIHAEATKKRAETLEMIRMSGMKAGIAFNPATKVDADAVKHADTALIMTVNPGHSGQMLMKAPLRKIAEIKKHNPIIIVGVDGGINSRTCGMARGADYAVATHAVTNAPDSRKAYKELMKKCNR